MFRAITSLMLLLLPLLAFGLEKEKNDLQIFYQDPTYAQFMHVTKALSAYPKDTATHSMAIIFTMLALQKHPEFSKNIVSDFEKLKQEEKELLYTGLVGTGNDKEAAEIVKKYTYHHPLTVNLKVAQIDGLQLLKQIQNGEALDQQAKIMNYLWAAFFATGDDKYLAKMIDYLVANKSLLSLEWNEKITTEQLLGKMATESLLWSLTSNGCQNETTRKQLIEIAKKNKFPELEAMIAHSCQSSQRPL